MSPSQHEAPTMIAERSGSGEMVEVTLPMRGEGPPERSPGLRRGEMLGRYVVLDELGRGGMGVVYAAYDPELERKIALKLVQSSTGQGTAGRTRLLREAQALARLTHPNIVGVYDVGTWERSVFVAMEFIEGENIARFIERRHGHSPPSWREALSVMIPAGRGLEAAHAAGIVHRDFKPENVMLSDSGRVLVLDFGLARATEAGPDSLSSMDASLSTSSRAGSSSMRGRLTATGSVMGTPAYMSPEQFAAGQSNEASDQFSYCVSLYHALYGMRPFAGETLPELSESVLTGEVEAAPRGSKVPAWLRRVLIRGLATRPADRYGSMTELLAALEQDPARRRNRILLGLGAVSVLGGASLAVAHLGTRPDACAQVDQAVRDAWGPPQRAALEQAFRHEAKTYSEQSIERVEQALERYAAGWVEQRRAACEAGRQAGTDAGRLASLQAACLDQRLRRFDALVRLFGDADQTMVTKAMSAVQQLPDPARCQDAEGLERATPMPDDPAQQEAVESIRLRLQELHALAVTGRLKEAEQKTTPILAEARALGFPPVIAEVLVVEGGVKAQLGEFSAALSALEEGLLLARAHGLERLEVDLLSPLVFLNTSYTSHFELAAWQARVLEVLVERVAPTPFNRARVLLDRGRLEHRRGRIAAAIDLLERAVEIHRASPDDLHAVNLVLTYEHLASAYMELERFDDAARVLEQAQEIASTALGADHPNRGNLLTYSARVEASRGNHARAAEHLQAALALYEGAYGDVHPNISAVLNGLGLQQEVLGQPHEAVASFRRAERLVVQAFGEEHAQVAIIEQNLGNALRRMGEVEEALRLHRRVQAARSRLPVDEESRYEILDNLGDDLRVLGRCDEAIAEYQAANAMREAVGGAREEGAAYALLGIGLCQWRGGEPSLARVTLKTALAQAEGEDGDDSWSRDTLALVRFSLAMVLRQLEPQSERASRLAQQAENYWGSDPVQFGDLLGQLEAWRGGEPAPMPVY